MRCATKRRTLSLEIVEKRAVFAHCNREAADSEVTHFWFVAREPTQRLRIASRDEGAARHVDEALADVALCIEIHRPLDVISTFEQDWVSDVSIPLALQDAEIASGLESNLANGR